MRGVTAKHSFTERVILAAKLDPGVYEEVEHDTGATGQALLVVLLSSIASGVGVLALGPLAIPAFTWASYTSSARPSLPPRIRAATGAN